MNQDNTENYTIPPQGVEEKNSDKKGNTMLKEIRDWVVAIAIAVALALFVRSYIFTLVKVQGASMEPTLQNADRLYVNRLFYTPEKGDVIIFIPEDIENNSGDADEGPKPYVKRVIATEGDTVYIDFTTGDVFVNGLLIDEPYINEPTTTVGNYILDLVAKGEYSPEKPIVVKEDHIFVLGDNRNNSEDSRHLGQIPIDDVLGGAVFRFWPLDNTGMLHQEAIPFGE